MNKNWEFTALLRGGDRSKWCCPSKSWLNNEYNSLCSSYGPLCWGDDDVEVSNLCSIYANYQLGRRNFRAACEAIRAHLQWGRHFASGDFAMDKVSGIGILLGGLRSAQRMAGDPKVTTDELLHLKQIVEVIPARIGMGRAFDRGERFASLASVLHPECNSAHRSEFSDGYEPSVTLLRKMQLDPNAALIEINRWYDQLRQLSRIRKSTPRMQAIRRFAEDTIDLSEPADVLRQLGATSTPSTRGECLGLVMVGYIKWNLE